MKLVYGLTGTIIDTIQPAINAITAELTVANIMLLVAAGLGIAMGFVLAWFGVRKLLSVITNAFKSGKAKV